MAEINVTPFVDVMLVLLVIFMVAAPLLAAGVQVNLPQTAADTLPQSPSEPVAVTIAADGTLSVGEDVVVLEEIPARLQADGVDPQRDRIHLRADGEARYEDVARVMAWLSASGYGNIGFVTDRDDAAAARAAAASAGAAAPSDGATAPAE